MSFRFQRFAASGLIACSLAFTIFVGACERKSDTAASPAPTGHGPAKAATTAPTDAERKAWAEAFRARHAELGKTPEGAVQLLVESAILASDIQSAEERARGRVWLQLLFIPYRDDPQWHTRPSNRTFVERLDHMPWIFASYVKGTRPEDGYRLPDGAPTLDIVRSEPRVAGGHSVVIRSSGADQPRPIVVRQSEQTGLWSVDQLANLYVDIRPPKKPGEETFR
jgi:hypothetical protein